MKRYVTDFKKWPADFPTHSHAAQFWEELGRAVATFSFLEGVLGRAIFAVTVIKPVPEADAEKIYKGWSKDALKNLSDPLGKLISRYEKVLRESKSAQFDGSDDLIERLRSLADIRNVLCHGSWGAPDKDGASIPFFVKPNGDIFSSEINIDYLIHVRAATVEAIAGVMNSITSMGYQFPGSRSPGIPIPAVPNTAADNQKDSGGSPLQSKKPRPPVPRPASRGGGRGGRA